jgi:hypothetical protein
VIAARVVRRYLADLLYIAICIQQFSGKISAQDNAEGIQANSKKSKN